MQGNKVVEALNQIHALEDVFTQKCDAEDSWEKNEIIASNRMITKILGIVQKAVKSCEEQEIQEEHLQEVLQKAKEVMLVICRTNGITKETLDLLTKGKDVEEER